MKCNRIYITNMSFQNYQVDRITNQEFFWIVASDFSSTMSYVIGAGEMSDFLLFLDLINSDFSAFFSLSMGS